MAFTVDKEMDHELKIAQNEEIDQRKDLAYRLNKNFK